VWQSARIIETFIDKDSGYIHFIFYKTANWNLSVSIKVGENIGVQYFGYPRIASEPCFYILSHKTIVSVENICSKLRRSIAHDIVCRLYLDGGVDVNSPGEMATKEQYLLLTSWFYNALRPQLRYNKFNFLLNGLPMHNKVRDK